MTTPDVAEPLTPHGWPGADIQSPGLSVRESPTVTAGKPVASIAKAARSTLWSLAIDVQEKNGRQQALR
ncbi:MAG: hypothetical protein EXR59_04710 [Dehalococcoidia bacterium]|nr:hypothetical protein [Dehalococcoidia bacterium]